MGYKRTVLITGGARGIGKGIAKSFLEAKHAVMIADLGGTSTGSEVDWAYDLSTDADTAATLEELTPLGDVSYTRLDVADQVEGHTLERPGHEPHRSAHSGVPGLHEERHGRTIPNRTGVNAATNGSGRPGAPPR